jgi:hypothetical protein
MMAVYHRVLEHIAGLEQLAAPARVVVENFDYGFQVGIGTEWPNAYRAAIRIYVRPSGGHFVREKPFDRLRRILRGEPRPRHPTKPLSFEEVWMNLCDFADRHGRAVRALQVTKEAA